MTYWLRWLAVLPAGAAAVVLVSFPVHWFLVLNCGLGPEVHCSVGPAVVSGPYRETVGGLERLAMAFFGPLAFVWAGQRVAPSRKVPTAVTLAALVILFLLVAPTALASAGYGIDYGLPQAVLNMLGLGAALWGAGLRVATDRAERTEVDPAETEPELTADELTTALRASVERARTAREAETSD